MLKRVYLVEGYRTPFLRANGAFAGLSAFELATTFFEGLLPRLKGAEHITDLFFANVLLDSRHPNLAREIALKLNRPWSCHFVSNNCISGFLSITSAANAIKCGNIDVALAGGVESMSNPPLLFNKSASRFFIDLANAKSISDKLACLLKFRPHHLLPQIPSPKEPSTGLTMGEHCELMVKEFNVERQAQDNLALQSHQNAIAAKAEHAKQIIPISAVISDNIPRQDTSLEKLGRLRPVFDRINGTLTAGNSSSLTDGASCVLLASEQACENHGLEPLAELIDYSYASLPPSHGLLMAPPLAIANLLRKNQLSLRDISIYEIHEAFAGQVLCNLAALKNEWSRYPLDLGGIEPEKLNLLGGSLAIGHPFAATGGRLALNTSQQLKKDELGLTSACAAGGMACAMILRGVV